MDRNEILKLAESEFRPTHVEKHDIVKMLSFSKFCYAQVVLRVKTRFMIELAIIKKRYFLGK